MPGGRSRTGVRRSAAIGSLTADGDLGNVAAHDQRRPGLAPGSPRRRRPGARSRSTRPSGVTSMTARSVMIAVDARRRAVSGSVHSLQDLLRRRPSATCSIMTITRLAAGDQVHRAAHALDHLAGDHPVGEVAVRGHLHRAQDRAVDVAAADHRERLGRREVGAARQLGDRLLAGVDQVGILLALVRERADAEHAVLRLQHDVACPAGCSWRPASACRCRGSRTCRRDSSRGGALGDLFACQGGMARRSSCGRCAARSASRSFGALEDALHVDAGRVHLIGIELAGLDQLLDLGDGDVLPAAAIIGLKLRAVFR